MENEWKMDNFVILSIYFMWTCLNGWISANVYNKDGHINVCVNNLDSIKFNKKIETN